MKCPKKWYFLFYECAIYRIKSKVAYLGQFFADLDEIYKSRATQVVSTHQISSWSDEKWHRYGTCSVSQCRRGPSNWVSKMNLLKAGGHSFWPRKLIGSWCWSPMYLPKVILLLFVDKIICWVTAGPQKCSICSKIQGSTVLRLDSWGLNHASSWGHIAPFVD